MGFHVGQTFGDYSITAVLGAGSMGRVFKVEHSVTKRTEAMKVLSAELATEIQIKRFEREMRALAKLSHSNIAALHNALHSEDQLVLLMEYIEGQTLEFLFSAGRLPLNTGLAYIRQMLSALGYAHQQGVVHRDVTPANVIVTADNEAKLTDFGLSKSYGDSLLTSCGEVLGSLPYLAPEQLKGTTQPDRRSDLYSVGAILYEHLTGQKPFGANRRLAPVLTDSEAEPQPPSQLAPTLSPQWDDIISRALARDPTHRYQSAEEFLGAMARIDQPAVADLPLPQLRTLGIGIALFAGLVLVLVASPALNRFRQVTPATAPWNRLHIAAPAFATVKTPPSHQIAADTMPQPAKPTEAPHAKRVPRSVRVSVFEPHPVAVTPHTALIVPAPLTLPTARSTPVGPISSAAAPVSPQSSPTAGPASATQDANEPPAATGAESGVSQDPVPAKKGFWRKLNVFKKQSAPGVTK
jgi:serine/threonine protein kinase